MALEEYKKKRSFEKTPEPAGSKHEAPGKPLRFVVQKHNATRLHYDFRLEAEGVLKSWAVPKGPSVNPEDKHLAVMVEDHPFDYRTFEGNIPKGEYGGGPVMVWDEGTYEPYGSTGEREADDKAIRQGIHRGHVTFILHGTKLGGEFALVKMEHAEEENAWLLIKAAKDKFARAVDILKQNRSVITGRTTEEIAAAAPINKLFLDLHGAKKQPLPTHPKPMLAETAPEPFDDPDWRFEVKWDGYRQLARIEPGGHVKLLSRNAQDYTEAFAPVAHDLSRLHVPALIDGEVVVVDEHGRSNFQMLQNYLRTGAGRLVYYAFDLLHLDSHDLMPLPLSYRQELLRRALPQGDHLRLSEAAPVRGKAIFAQATNSGLEGLMAKRSSSAYKPGSRSRDWLKLKTVHRQEVVIGGYTAPRAGRKYFGSLVLGVYQDGKLTYAGHVGTGFDDATLKSLYQRMQPLRTKICPFDPEPKTNEPATWIRPELVCEIAFTEWTDENLIRHPSFLGLREDKSPKDVLHEPEGAAPKVAAVAQNAPTSANEPQETIVKIGSKSVKVTHRGKEFWPGEGITKGELIDYYRSVKDYLLPYLKDRPESLNRFPHGLGSESFYQKNMQGQVPDWAKTVVVHSDGESRDLTYLLCQDEATMVYMVQLGCIEFNPWNSRTGSLDKPDWCVIDLDPEDIGFGAVIETALTVKKVLDELKVPSYPKTSGKTGIHIYIPLGAKYSYDQAKVFAQLVANLSHAQLPKITSVERLPAKRQGKVYLDFLQNRRGQTLAQAYSVRPAKHATVSAPLDWAEVAPGLQPEQFTIRNMAARLEQVGDLWKPVTGKGIDLKLALKALEP
jgi:bifunctional non-homologous end joining protein LigD